MNRIGTAALGLAVGAVSLPSLAHHSRANFSDEILAFQATVTRFEWVNPHVYVYVEAPDENGVMTEWEVETQSTPNLIRRGWTADSLSEGEVITIRANPDRNPRKKLLFGMAFTKADGTVLASQGSAGRVIVDDVPGAASLAGVWETTGWSAGPRDTAATHLPLTEKAKAATVGFSVSQNPMVQCIPNTPPGNMGGPYVHGIEILEDRVIMRAEYNEVTRTVYTDGRSHPASLEVSNQGHSIGRWEDGVLVVDTTGLEAHRWGNGRGIPSGQQRHVVERYTLSDDGKTVRLDYFFEDPEYLTEPVTGVINWRHAPHLSMLPNRCDPAVSRRFVSQD